jgi:hypothetical protein
MIIRCPKCKFAGAISATNRMTVEQPFFCPRCQTLIIYPDEQLAPVASSVQGARKTVQLQRVDWEMRSSCLDLAAFWRTSKSILFRPSAIFSTLDYEGGIGNALVYLLIYGSLGQIIGRYWITLLGIHYGIIESNAIDNTLRFAGTILLTPVLFLALIFVAAGLVHLVLRILLANRRPFSATFQVMAYASGATSMINLIPFLGRIVMPLWALVLYFVGLSKAHQTSKAKVVFALLLPLVILGLLAFGVILAIAVSHVVEFLQVLDNPL